MDCTTKRSLIMMALACSLLTACVSPTVLQAPPPGVDFGSYKTVGYTIHDTPTTERGSGEEAIAYARETIALFDALLGPQLRGMGYTVTTESPDFNIDIAVTAVKPGSAAARFWVGFGAGRAVLLFDATFTDQSGKTLGAFQGGRSHTGLEFGQSFASVDEIKTFAATGAVAQVEQFMKNGSFR